MKQDWSKLERFRMGGPKGERYGAFVYQFNGQTRACIIASCGQPESEGWEHVSVHIREDIPSFGGGRETIMKIPAWGQMDHIKRLFWEDDEVVVQFHIGGEDKVNIHNEVLHLWKHESSPFPAPPKILV